MDAHQAWLAQADVFAEALVVSVSMNGEGLAADISNGPALLLTHDCAMDKATPDGVPKIDWLQFTRLRLATDLPPERRGNLWRARTAVAPYDVMWLGDVGFGECYLVLSTPYFAPVQYFGLTCVQYEEVVDDRANLPRATPTRNDSRIGRLDDVQLFLLQQKMLIYWTRFAPPTAPPEA